MGSFCRCKRGLESTLVVKRFFLVFLAKAKSYLPLCTHWSPSSWSGTSSPYQRLCHVPCQNYTQREREQTEEFKRERENVSLNCLFFFFLWRRKGLEDLRHGSWICRGRKVGVTNHATRIDSLPQCRSLKLVRCGWATVSFLSSSALSRVASFTRRRRARRCCLVVLRR